MKITKAKLYKFFEWSVTGLFWFIIVSLIALTLIFVRYGNDLPNYMSLASYRPPIATRLYAADGTMLIEYANERRVFLEYNDIPKNLINAFVSAEDQNFWNHPGIDITGITRAFVFNTIRALGGPAKFSGGSTITQQVAKNFFLTREQSISRKLREMILALKLERTFSKEHIITLYMNQIYLGVRAYGVGSAALMYFNKPVSELTIAESAFLAGLPKAPTTYNPVTNYEGALNRRNWVINRMYAEGYITKSERDEALDSDLNVSNEFIQQQKDDFLYFAEEVRRRLLDSLGHDQLYEEGLYIKTTLNPELQEVATNALRKAILDYDRTRGFRGPEAKIKFGQNNEWTKSLRRTRVASGVPSNWRKAVILSTNGESATIGFETGNKETMYVQNSSWAAPATSTQSMVGGLTDFRNILKPGYVVFVEKTDRGYELRQNPEIQGAIMAINPHTGRVIAMSGGFSFVDSSFNRATQAYRQPGSSIKPFLYLAALMRPDFTPATIILDAPIVEDNYDGTQWKPANFDNKFLGEIPLRMALETSRNLPAIRLAQSIGIRNAVSIAEKFGIYKPSLFNMNLSMALGTGETTLEKMTLAFASFVNGGKKIDSTIVDIIEDRDGKVIYQNQIGDCEDCNSKTYNGELPPAISSDYTPLADAQSLYQITSILQGVVERGTGRQAQVPGHTIAGKTGTTNEVKDVWFIGFSKNLVVGVYMGFDQPKTLGAYSGSHMPAKVFSEFMTEALKNEKNQPFSVPNGITFVRIDRETGKPVDSSTPANRIISESFKNNEIGNIYNPTEEKHENTYGDPTITKPAPKASAKIGDIY